MKSTILLSLILLYIQLQAEAQTSGNCQGNSVGSCKCQFNNVESLLTLIRSEVQTEVAARLASTPGINFL